MRDRQEIMPHQQEIMPPGMMDIFLIDGRSRFPRPWEPASAILFVHAPLFRDDAIHARTGSRIHSEKYAATASATSSIIRCCSTGSSSFSNSAGFGTKPASKRIDGVQVPRTT